MSEPQQPDNQTVLKIAWQRQAEFGINATKASDWYLRLRQWVIILAVLATLLAILADVFREQNPLVGNIFKWALIIVPILSSGVLAFANKFQQGEHWLALRTGAEEIKKEIYLYRTLLQGQEDRHHWLTDRLATIHRQVYEIVGDNLVLIPYTGPVPRNYNPTAKNSDPGFDDLLADDYLRYRVDNQLSWHARQIAKLQPSRMRLQVGIFFFSGLGALLAAIGANLSIWVAFTSALAVALAAWLEVRRLDSTLNNYNQVVLELNLIRDHWHSLKPEEQTGAEFFKLVTATERVLWSQHNQYINEMRQAVADLKSKDDDMVAQVLKVPVSPAIDQALLAQARQRYELAEKTSPSQKVETPLQKITRRAFVIIPVGHRQTALGDWIDFDSVYQNLIRPALLEAGFTPTRADDRQVSGGVDTFQALLLDEVVLADISVDDADVFYQLGVRHTLRKRGIIHLRAQLSPTPFDLFNVRTLLYNCDKKGKPDPKLIDGDKQAIIKMVQEMAAVERSQIQSPVFRLLEGLTEPDRYALQTPLATGYWGEYNTWQARVKVAQRRGRLGDILLLTEEVRNPLVQEEAIAEAGRVLKQLDQDALALQQYERGLELNPQQVDFQREAAFHLTRLHHYAEALDKLKAVLAADPTDSESLTYVGQVYKEMWTQEWLDITNNHTRLQTAYEGAYLLKQAINTYLAAYRLDQNHYRSGNQALLLVALLDYLAQVNDGPEDLEVASLRQQLPSLRGAVQFSLDNALRQDPHNFEALIAHADLALCLANTPHAVSHAYKKALALGGSRWVALETIIHHLELLNLLGFRSEYVRAGVTILQEVLQQDYQDNGVEQGPEPHPPQVFLFSGHMFDQPERPTPRFPPAMTAEAQQRIEEALNKLAAAASDLAITPGAACGGDILFIEACLRRALKVEIYMPFPETEFMEKSVSFAGEDWVERFHKIRLDPNVTMHFQANRLGEAPAGVDVFARNNRWALYSTLAYGVKRVRLIALWDGQGGDGPGGTGHMVQEVRRFGGVVEHLDTTKFAYWRPQTQAVAKVVESDLQSPA